SNSPRNLRSQRSLGTSQNCRCYRVGCAARQAARQGVGGFDNDSLRRHLGDPKKAKVVFSTVGTTAERSKYLLPRSQEVSGSSEQAWQAAPCSFSPLSTECSEQSGSDAHKLILSNALRMCRPSLSGSPSAQSPPSVPSLSEAAV